MLFRLPFLFYSIFLFILILPPPRSTLFPYTTLFRSCFTLQRFYVGLSHLTATNQCLSVKTYWVAVRRSEEHTSELQSHSDVVCRLLLEKKNQHGVHAGAADVCLSPLFDVSRLRNIM